MKEQFITHLEKKYGEGNISNLEVIEPYNPEIKGNKFRGILPAKMNPGKSVIYYEDVKPITITGTPEWYNVEYLNRTDGSIGKISGDDGRNCRLNR